jgi:hypothetical protein
VAAHDVEFGVEVCGVAVEAYHDGLSVFLHILNVAVKVLESFGESFSVGFLDFVYADSAVHLQALGCGYDDGNFRLQTRFAALDVKEFLGAEVGA